MVGYSLLLLLGGGAIGGFIDAIAGGAALVTMPTLAIVLGPGVQVIATSKLVGGVAALIALLVFFAHGHMDWKRGFAFGLWVGLGAWAGSTFAPYLPVTYFRWMLVALCPLLLAVVWQRDRWAKASLQEAHRVLSPLSVVTDPRCIFAGLACGFYDGFFGPAGGTFYILALVFIVRMNLLTAMAVAKLVNVVSAATALVNFSLKHLVQWEPGFWMALAVGIGAFVGAKCATRGAARVVRPVLAVVVMLLLAHLILVR